MLKSYICGIFGYQYFRKFRKILRNLRNLRNFAEFQKKLFAEFCGICGIYGNDAQIIHLRNYWISILLQFPQNFAEFKEFKELCGVSEKMHFTGYVCNTMAACVCMLQVCTCSIVSDRYVDPMESSMGHTKKMMFPTENPGQMPFLSLLETSSYSRVPYSFPCHE